MTPFVTRRGPALCLTSFAGGVVVHFSFPCELVSSSNGHQISSVSQHPKLSDFKDFTKMDELMNNVFYVLYIYTHHITYNICFPQSKGFNPKRQGRAAMAPASLGQFEEETCLRAAGEADASQTQGDRAIGPCDTVCMTHGAYTV